MANSSNVLETLKYPHDSPRAGFVLKHCAVASVSAYFFGVAAGMLGASVFPLSWGPIAPYLVSSSIGYGLAGMFMWKSELNEAQEWTRLYPRMLKHHLALNSPKVVDAEEVISQAQSYGSLTLGNRSWLILACRAALPDLYEIEQQKAMQILDDYVGGEEVESSPAESSD